MAFQCNGLGAGQHLPSGRYKLCDPVPNAQGAFGSVYEGENSSGTKVAIKKIAMSRAIESLRSIYPNLPNPRAHMAREWRSSLRSVSHPNICRTYDIEFTDRRGGLSKLTTCDYAYLVMEWAGTALIDVVLQRQGLREEEARSYFYQTLDGIQALHARGISHRDVKPENVTLIGECVKIVDFGLAKTASQGPPTSDVGTPRYKAPEIAQSARRGLIYDSKVDVWSLGCTLYEMLTAKGSEAHKRNGVQRMNSKEYRHGDIPAARRIIQQCLTADPTLRPTVHDLLADPWFDGLRPSAAASAPEPEAKTEHSEVSVEEEVAKLSSASQEEYGRRTVLQMDLNAVDSEFLISEEVTYDDIVQIADNSQSELRLRLCPSSISKIQAWRDAEAAITDVERLDPAWAKSSLAKASGQDVPSPEPAPASANQPEPEPEPAASTTVISGNIRADTNLTATVINKPGTPGQDVASPDPAPASVAHDTVSETASQNEPSSDNAKVPRETVGGHVAEGIPPTTSPRTAVPVGLLNLGQPEWKARIAYQIIYGQDSRSELNDRDKLNLAAEYLIGNSENDDAWWRAQLSQ